MLARVYEMETIEDVISRKHVNILNIMQTGTQLSQKNTNEIIECTEYMKLDHLSSNAATRVLKKLFTLP